MKPNRKEWREFHYGKKQDKGYNKPIWSLVYDGGKPIIRNATYGMCVAKKNILLRNSRYLSSKFKIS